MLVRFLSPPLLFHLSADENKSTNSHGRRALPPQPQPRETYKTHRETQDTQRETLTRFSSLASCSSRSCSKVFLPCRPGLMGRSSGLSTTCCSQSQANTMLFTSCKHTALLLLQTHCSSCLANTLLSKSYRHKIQPSDPLNLNSLCNRGFCTKLKAPPLVRVMLSYKLTI